MRRFIILLAGLFCAITVNGQNHRFAINFRPGVALPWSGFQKGPKPGYNGYAFPGLFIGFEVTQIQNSNIAAGMIVSGALFGVDGDAWRDGFMKNDHVLTDVDIEAEPYRIYSFTGGLVFKMPVKGTIIHLRGRLMAGLTTVRSPNILFRFHFRDVASAVLFQPSEQATNFVLYTGLGLTVDLGRRIVLSFDADYLGTDMLLYYNTILGSGSSSRKIAFIALTPGLIFAF